jgi:hypothetical protein
LAGEKYDHDKGVSAELIEREKDRDGDHGQSEVERGREGREIGLSECQHGHGQGQSCGSPVHKYDVGVHVQLDGRKAVVLDVGLADVVEGPTKVEKRRNEKCLIM